MWLYADFLLHHMVWWWNTCECILGFESSRHVTYTRCNCVVLTFSDSHEPTRKRSREYTRRVAHQTVYDRTWLLARLCREKSLHITLDNKRESNLLRKVKTCGTNKKKTGDFNSPAAYLLSSAAMTCKHAVVGLTSSMDEAGVGLCGPVMGFGLQIGVAAGGGELGWG